jgi:excisionase family DNA binding protein
VAKPTPINTPAPRYAGLTAAAKYAAVPIGTLRDWVRRGLLPAYRIGTRLLQVDLNDIDRMRRRVPAAAPPAKAKGARSA